MKKARTPRTAYWRAVGVLFAALLVLNAIGFVPGVADFYAVQLYPALTDPLSRLCDSTRVPIGEFIMFAGIALVLLGVLVGVLYAPLRKYRAFTSAARSYLKALLAVCLCTLLLFTLNYLLPLRATPLVQTMSTQESAYTLDQLETLRNEVVESLNATAQQAPRTEDGSLVYSENADEKVASALQRLGNQHPRLSGFYPQPKPALCSDILEWMGIGGYTYPYTMEITYNRYVSKLYYPVLSAHESVHHKGYYLESEAEYLSYLACAQSDDALLHYSGYENIYYYVEDAYAKALLDAYTEDDARARYRAQVQVSEQVVADRTRVAQERSQAYEEGVNKAAEEALSSTAGDVSKLGWDTQEQILQQNNYAGVVELLLADRFG